jgi:hypothetical protein
LGVLLAK